MPEKTSTRIPKYRLHKPTGLGVVRVSDRDIYLGRHGTDESRQKYQHVIADWLANNRQLVDRQKLLDSAHGLSVDELILAYLEHAAGYYVKNGEPTGEVDNIKEVMKHLSRLRGKVLVSVFGPIALKSVRQAVSGRVKPVLPHF
jgi:hypothetical protein